MKKLILSLVLLMFTSVSFAITKPPARSKAAINAFVKQNACPGTGLHKLPCKGFIIDHKKAIACGGLDKPINMQWQTVAEAKAKDKVERIGCKLN